LLLAGLLPGERCTHETGCPFERDRVFERAQTHRVLRVNKLLLKIADLLFGAAPRTRFTLPALVERSSEGRRHGEPTSLFSLSSRTMDVVTTR
jgi:hypothetical protein